MACVCVIPSVCRVDLLLRFPQGVDRLVGMSTEPDASIGGLSLLNAMNRAFSSAIRIPQIGMMDFIGQGGCRYENRAQRSNDDLFHDFPLQDECHIAAGEEHTGGGCLS